MDDTTGTEATPEEPERARSRNRWALIAAVVAVLAVAGVVGAILIVNSDDTPDYSATQIRWMQDGCQQWADADERPNGPDDEWCQSMARWMNGRMGERSMMDRGQMMGPMMWQDPYNMRATCEQWTTETNDGADTSAWCEQMTTWMTQNMGDWDNWMTNGPP